VVSIRWVISTQKGVLLRWIVDRHRCALLDFAAGEDDATIDDRGFDATFERFAVPRGVTRFAEAFLGVVNPLSIRVEQADIASSAFG
jgi:hypothetical protein